MVFEFFQAREQQACNSNSEERSIVFLTSSDYSFRYIMVSVLY